MNKNNVSTEERNEAKRIFKLLIKIVFTIGAISLIINKADLPRIGEYLKSMHPGYVLVALLTLNFGQVVSSFRLKYYFSTAKLNFTSHFAVAIYYIGMFFNRLLPGGIGGDGYITYWLKKHHNVRVRTSIRLLLSSRASGLLLLMVFAFLLGLCSVKESDLPHWNILMVMGITLTIISYSFFTKLLLKEKLKTQIGAMKYSVIVQGAVILAAASLFASTGTTDFMYDYLMIFMVSSVMTLVPISFGGAGMRELTYFYSAVWFGLDAELGIAVSVVYFLLDTFSSLAGLYFWNHIDKIKVFRR